MHTEACACTSQPVIKQWVQLSASRQLCRVICQHEPADYPTCGAVTAAKCAQFIFRRHAIPFVLRQKPACCEADYAAEVLLTTRHPLLLCRKYALRTYSDALFNFSFPMVRNLQYLWHDFMDDYIVSHSAAGKCEHLCDVWQWWKMHIFWMAVSEKLNPSWSHAGVVLPFFKFIYLFIFAGVLMV